MKELMLGCYANVLTKILMKILHIIILFSAHYADDTKLSVQWIFFFSKI